MSNAPRPERQGDWLERTLAASAKGPVGSSREYMCGVGDIIPRLFRFLRRDRIFKLVKKVSRRNPWMEALHEKQAACAKFCWVLVFDLDQFKVILCLLSSPAFATGLNWDEKRVAFFSERERSIVLLAPLCLKKKQRAEPKG